MGIADEYRRKESSGLTWVWVGFFGTLAVGSLICWGVWVAMSQGRQWAAIEATHRALAKRGITDVGEEVKVEAFGEATCLVTGQCMHGGSLGVYVGTCKLVNDRWQVVSLRLPVQEINESWKQVDKLLKEAGQ